MSKGAASVEDRRLPEHERLRTAAPACTSSLLTMTWGQMVLARGDPQAKLWLIGEAPDADENAQGVPFSGKAGQLLDKILEAAGIGQDEVFITNTVLRRPPGNRTPTNDEIAACSVHRNALLDLWKPPLVVLLGATAARTFLGGQALAERRGQRVERDGRAFYPTFHPTYLLRNPRHKAAAWEDWQVIRDALRGLPPDGGASQPEQADGAAKARSLMPYLDRSVMTPEGTGRLVQVFRERSAVVLDARPAKVVFFATEVLAELQLRQAAV